MDTRAYRFHNFLFDLFTVLIPAFVLDRSRAHKKRRMDTRAYRFHNFLFDLFTVLIPAFVLDRS